MKPVIFSRQALDDFEFWKTADKKICKRIKELINNIQVNPFQGIGKPEPLKYHRKGYWSRRITQEHRLIYIISEKNEIIIASCKGHYK